MQLGAFVLRTACATTLQLQRDCRRPPLAVCVNVSVVQLNAPTFVEDVLAHRHGDRARRPRHSSSS